MAWYLKMGGSRLPQMATRRSCQPSAVKEATSDWRKAADHITRFVREALIIEPDGVVSATALYNHYKAWCEKNGERPLSNKALIPVITASFDVIHDRTRRGSDWFGLKLRI